MTACTRCFGSILLGTPRRQHSNAIGSCNSRLRAHNLIPEPFPLVGLIVQSRPISNFFQFQGFSALAVYFRCSCCSINSRKRGQRSLENKYLRVHEYRLPPHLRLNQLLSPPTDRSPHSIGRRDFVAKTLRLLKTLRAALIYLSLAIYTEERFRSQERDPNQTIPVLPTDDFKV